MPNSQYKRILIIGDAGRGKTTFAENLSKKLSIPTWSTDDFYWKNKFTLPNDRKKSIEDINQIYDNEKWIVDGTTRHLIQKGLELADVIYLLEFKNILSQYYFLTVRHFKRDNESFASFWELMVHITRKRYKKGYRNQLPSLKDMLEPYSYKVITLHTFKEIHKELKA